MAASAPVERHTREEIAVVQETEDALEEAEVLLAGGHPSMAVICAVSCVEPFIKNAFLRPYLERMVLNGSPELSEAVLDVLLGPGHWQGRLPKIIHACWGIDVGRMQAWREMQVLQKIRNEIVHGGKRCSAEDARRHLSTCNQLVRAMLNARLDAVPRS